MQYFPNIKIIIMWSVVVVDKIIFTTLIIRYSTIFFPIFFANLSLEDRRKRSLLVAYILKSSSLRTPGTIYSYIFLSFVLSFFRVFPIVSESFLFFSFLPRSSSKPYSNTSFSFFFAYVYSFFFSFDFLLTTSSLV
jgi:hypothetical protein